MTELKLVQLVYAIVSRIITSLSSLVYAYLWKRSSASRSRSYRRQARKALCNPLFLDQSSRPQRLGLSKEHQGCHVETLWISHRLALATVDPFAPVASSVIAREGVSEPEGFSPNVSCVDYPKELKKKLTTLGIKIGIESTIVFL
ncbi:hypothetical protein V6N13_071755 [Hibiscus sabdariffa]